MDHSLRSISYITDIGDLLVSGQASLRKAHLGPWARRPFAKSLRSLVLDHLFKLSKKVKLSKLNYLFIFLGDYDGSFLEKHFIYC